MPSRKTRVGINGFGRIGRCLFRQALARESYDVVCINDLNPDPRNMAYLLKYDTTYGRLKRAVDVKGSSLLVDGDMIDTFHKRDVTQVPWEEYGVELVVDSTGNGKCLEAALKLPESIRNIIVTNVPKIDDYATLVFGCNEDTLVPEESRVISTSICDAVAFLPIAKLMEEKLGIETGHLVTLHPWLKNQNLLDAPLPDWTQPGELLSNFALGRAATTNLIPKVTSAIKASGKVMADIGERVHTFSYRVPTSAVTSAVFTFMAGRDTNAVEVVEMLRKYQREQKRDVLECGFEPLVSGDYVGAEFSAVIDERWISVAGDRHVRLMYWYDNEWGYASRVADALEMLGRHYNESA